MQLQKGVDWQKNEYKDIKPGLVRIKKALKAIGDPHLKLSFVHVAGTNGKGSTASFISSMLHAAGFKAGLYTSPHLNSITERIKVNGKNIYVREFDRLSGKYEDIGKKFKLTYFEFLSLIAFQYFKEQKTDVVVLEAGLGGRFDATNVISEPLVSVITGIGKDHQEYLGNSIKDIAFEKAGIIKRGAPVVLSKNRRQASVVIKKISKAGNSTLYEFGNDFVSSVRSVDWENRRQTVRYRGLGNDLDLSIGLMGRFQEENLGSAVAAVLVLRKKGFNITDNAIKRGAKTTKWPGRFQIKELPGKATLIIDGAHNPHGLESFFRTWNDSPFAKKDTLFIFGVLKEKQVSDMVRIVAQHACEVCVVPCRSERTAAVETVAGLFRKHMPSSKVSTERSLTEALDNNTNKKIFAAIGSLYLSAEAVKYN